MKSFIILVVLVLSECGAWPVTESSEETEEILARSEQTSKNQPSKSAVDFTGDNERKPIIPGILENLEYVDDEPVENAVVEDMSTDESNQKTIEDNNSDSSYSGMSISSVTESNNTKTDEENIETVSKESDEIFEDSKMVADVELNLGSVSKEFIDSRLEDDFDVEPLLADRRMMNGAPDIVDRTGNLPEIGVSPRRQAVIANPSRILTTFRNNYEIPTYLKNRIERRFYII